MKLIIYMNLRRYFRINIHAFCFGVFATGILFILHLLPINQIFIDPFSEAIKHHDVMDIAFSKFRDHNKAELFDSNIVVINSGITNRERLAKSISLLNSMGTKVIGLDLLVDTFYNTRSDTMLRNAIQEADNIVLGYTFKEGKQKEDSNLGIIPHPFFASGKLKGYVNLATNDSFSIRAYEPFHIIEGKKEPSFTTKIAQLTNPVAEQNLTHLKSDKQWINFRRVQPGLASMIFPINKDSAIHYTLIEMYNLLRDSSLYLSNNYFKNKIVLIGFVGENEHALSMKDRYFTPLNEQYTGRSKPDMSGVFIHANIISMVLANDFIKDIPEWVLYIFSLFIFYLNYLIFSAMQSSYNPAGGVIIRLIQVVEFIILFSVAIILLVRFNTKLGFFLIATSVILSFELFEIYERRLEHTVNGWITSLRNIYRK